MSATFMHTKLRIGQYISLSHVSLVKSCNSPVKTENKTNLLKKDMK